MKAKDKKLTLKRESKPKKHKSKAKGSGYDSIYKLLNVMIR